MPKVIVYGLSGEESLEVLQVDIVETWIVPYQRYFVDGMLLAEPTKAKTIKRNARRYTLVDGGYTHPIPTCVSGDQCTCILKELHEDICGSHVEG